MSGLSNYQFFADNPEPDLPESLLDAELEDDSLPDEHDDSEEEEFLYGNPSSSNAGFGFAPSDTLPPPPPPSPLFTADAEPSWGHRGLGAMPPSPSSSLSPSLSPTLQPPSDFSFPPVARPAHAATTPPPFSASMASSLLASLSSPVRSSPSPLSDLSISRPKSPLQAAASPLSPFGSASAPPGFDRSSFAPSSLFSLMSNWQPSFQAGAAAAAAPPGFEDSWPADSHDDAHQKLETLLPVLSFLEEDDAGDSLLPPSMRHHDRSDAGDDAFNEELLSTIAAAPSDQLFPTKGIHRDPTIAKIRAPFEPFSLDIDDVPRIAALEDSISDPLYTPLFASAFAIHLGLTTGHAVVLPRQALVSELVALLLDCELQSRGVALRGQIGGGKSIAAELLVRRLLFSNLPNSPTSLLVHWFPDGIFHYTFSHKSGADIDDFYAQLVQFLAMDRSGRAGAAPTSEDAAAHIQQLSASKKALLFLDNVASVDVMRSLANLGAGCKIVLTTRRAQVATAAACALRQYTVPSLSQLEAECLFVGMHFHRQAAAAADRPLIVDRAESALAYASYPAVKELLQRAVRQSWGNVSLVRRLFDLLVETSQRAMQVEIVQLLGRVFSRTDDFLTDADWRGVHTSVARSLGSPTLLLAECLAWTASGSPAAELPTPAAELIEAAFDVSPLAEARIFFELLSLLPEKHAFPRHVLAMVWDYSNIESTSIDLDQLLAIVCDVGFARRVVSFDVEAYHLDPVFARCLAYLFPSFYSDAGEITQHVVARYHADRLIPQLPPPFVKPDGFYYLSPGIGAAVDASCPDAHNSLRFWRLAGALLDAARLGQLSLADRHGIARAAFLASPGHDEAPAWAHYAAYLESLLAGQQPRGTTFGSAVVFLLACGWRRIDRSQSYRWFEQGLSDGDLLCSFYFGAALLLEQKTLQALVCFARAALLGHPDASFIVANAHFHGRHGFSKDEALGLAWFAHAAAQGHADAQTLLGRFHLQGSHGASKDADAAVYWLLQAADQGSAEADYLLGRAIEAGVWPVGDLRAVERLRRAAAHGLRVAETALAQMYAAGRAVPRDAVEVMRIIDKAAATQDRPLPDFLAPDVDPFLTAVDDAASAKQAAAPSSTTTTAGKDKLAALKASSFNIHIPEDAHSEFIRGRNYFHGTDGCEQSYEEATKWFLKAAQKGHPDSQFCLGECYNAGKGVPHDDTQAAFWYKEASDKGYALAQNSLAGAYMNGVGVEKNEAEAMRLYRKAAEQGLAAAQNNLGFALRHSTTAEFHNEKESVGWFRKAAEQGHAAAQHNLGDALLLGRGVDKNEKEAVFWYQKAAEQGVAQAQFCLAVAFWLGKGVKQERTERVLRWLLRSKNQGYQAAVDFVNDIKIKSPTETPTAYRYRLQMLKQQEKLVAQEKLGEPKEPPDGSSAASSKAAASSAPPTSASIAQSSKAQTPPRAAAPAKPGPKPKGKKRGGKR